MSGLTGLEELAAYIDRNGTRRAFAENLDISEGYLSALLSGDRPFSRVNVTTALKISQLSGISIERLNGLKPAAAAPTRTKQAGRR